MNNATIKIAPVRKSLVVAASALRAFEVFTAGMDRWWPKTHSIGNTPVKTCVIEPFVGGRWYNQCEDGSEITVGHVRVWEPGQRLVVTWEINSQWKPDARVQLASEVEVRFVGLDESHTRVEIDHHDFERMGAGPGEAMRNAVDNGWPGILELFSRDLTNPTS